MTEEPSDNTPADQPPAPNRPRWPWPDALALLLWTTVVSLFFARALLCQGAFFYFDITEINLPYRDFFARELQSGRFSRWIPGLFCGHPLYSESQTGYLHPFKYLFYPWMPPWKAFGYDCVLSVWLTGAAAYGWLRRHVGPAGALSGASVFALSGYTWAHFIHTSMLNALPSVPLILWAVEAAWRGGRFRPLVLGALALACQVFAGHLQDTLMTGLAVGVLGLWRACTVSGLKNRLWAVGSVALLGALGILLSAIQWVPSKELIDRSPRTEMTWKELTYGSWHPQLLPSAVIRHAYGSRARNTDWPDGFYPYHEMNIYMGVATLGLAVVGLGARRNRWLSAWIVLGALGVLLMLGRYTFLMDHMHQVPFLGRGRVPVRYHLWLLASVSALSAVGVDRLARPGPVRLKPAFAFVTALLLISALILAAAYWPIWSNPHRWTRPTQLERFEWLGQDLLWGCQRTALVLLAAGTLATLAARSANPRLRFWLSMGLPLVIIADLLASHWNEAPTIDPTYWNTPPASARWIAQRGDAIRILGENTLHSAEPGYASRPVNFFAVRELLSWSLPPVWNLKSCIGVTPIYSIRRFLYQSLSGLPGKDLEGMSYLVSGLKIRLRDQQAIRVGSVWIVPNPQARPRARFVGNPTYAASRSEAAEILLQGGFDIRQRLLVEDPKHPLSPDTPVLGSARITRETPEHVEIQVHAQTPGYLLLTDTYDPGWSVSVNGQPGVIRPAYLAFRAVFLPRGEHHLVFDYEPAGWKTGLILSCLGALLGLLLILAPWTMPRLGDGRLDPPLPPWWPWILLALIVLVLLASTLKVDQSGVSLQSRWNQSWHPFTWGAGLEAIQPPPPLPDFD